MIEPIWWCLYRTFLLQRKKLCQIQPLLKIPKVKITSSRLVNVSILGLICMMLTRSLLSVAWLEWMTLNSNVDSQKVCGCMQCFTMRPVSWRDTLMRTRLHLPFGNTLSRSIEHMHPWTYHGRFLLLLPESCWSYFFQVFSCMIFSRPKIGAVHFQMNEDKFQSDSFAEYARTSESSFPKSC